MPTAHVFWVNQLATIHRSTFLIIVIVAVVAAASVAVAARVERGLWLCQIHANTMWATVPTVACAVLEETKDLLVFVLRHSLGGALFALTPGPADLVDAKPSRSTTVAPFLAVVNVS